MDGQQEEQGNRQEKRLRLRKTAISNGQQGIGMVEVKAGVEPEGKESPFLFSPDLDIVLVVM